MLAEVFSYSKDSLYLEKEIKEKYNEDSRLLALKLYTKRSFSFLKKYTGSKHNQFIVSASHKISKMKTTKNIDNSNQ